MVFFSFFGQMISFYQYLLEKLLESVYLDTTMSHTQTWTATREQSHTLALADCFLSDLDPLLEGKPVAAILTDPPYSSGGRGVTATRKNPSKKYLQKGKGSGRFPEIMGEFMDQRCWARWCAGWLSDLKKYSQPETYLMSFVDWRQQDALKDAIQIADWWHRGTLAWYKSNVRAPHLGMFQQPEFIHWATAGALKARREGSMIPGSFTAPYVRKRSHMTQKPVEVLSWLLSILPKDLEGLVVDPFSGSASTAVAADLAGRDSVLVEKSPEILAKSLERLEADGFTIDGPEAIPVGPSVWMAYGGEAAERWASPELS